MKRIKQLQEQINILQSEIDTIKSNFVGKWYQQLDKEIRDLIYATGNFIAADYYAPERVYSVIPGVKNIRFGHDDTIVVKLTEDIPLPETVDVDGTVYQIRIIKSKNYQR